MFLFAVKLCIFNFFGLMVSIEAHKETSLSDLLSGWRNSGGHCIKKKKNGREKEKRGDAWVHWLRHVGVLCSCQKQTSFYHHAVMSDQPYFLYGWPFTDSRTDLWVLCFTKPCFFLYKKCSFVFHVSLQRSSIPGHFCNAFSLHSVCTEF